MSLEVAAQDVQHFNQQRIAHSIEDLVAFLAVDHDVFGAQDCEMLRSVRLLQPEPFDDLACREFAITKLLDNGNASRVRQGLKDIGLKLPKGIGHSSPLSE